MCASIIARHRFIIAMVGKMPTLRDGGGDGIEG
jgi:hypothetical protein